MKILAFIKKDILIFSKSKSSIIVSFLVPMVLTLIFGLIFGGMGKRTGMNAINIIAVNEDNSEFSETFLKELSGLEEININRYYLTKNDSITFDLESMDDWVKRGKRKLGILIPSGFEQNIKDGNPMELEVHYDPKFAVEYGIVRGLMEKMISMKFPNVIFNRMWKSAESHLGNEKGKNFQSNIEETVKKYFPEADFDLDSQMQAMNQNNETKMDNQTTKQDSSSSFMPKLMEVTAVKLLGEEKGNIMFSQNVAGFAVMFLLFSVSAVGSTLLEEKKNGTISRLLIAPIKPYQILVSKLLYACLLGLCQLVVLFIFGWLVFKLNIFKDIPALLIMMISTSICCSSLGLFLATICKNEQQVSSLSTLIVLGMSALGGSMVPSFVMPLSIQKIGRFTVNHWAMKGFTDVLWRNLHLKDILPNIIVLLSVAIVFVSLSTYFFNKRLFKD